MTGVQTCALPICRGRIDKALLTRSARELAATVTRRYGLIQPANEHSRQYQQGFQAFTPPPRQSAPIAPTAVHPAGTGEIPRMPPNLTSVPHPGAQPPQPNPGPNPNPYTQYPHPPTVSGTVV